MTECQKCSRKAQLFLCQGCMTDLREMLQGLAARWLQFLQDAALGHTRLGDAVRHRRGGPEALDSMWEEMGRNKQAGNRELASFLAAGGVNKRASDLLHYVNSVLVEWARDICETRGVQIPNLKTSSQIASWLARNVSAIAADEGAGVCYREIKGIVEDIERVINRPVPHLPLGPCPTLTSHRERCNYRLEARRGVKEVTCPECSITHNVEELIAVLIIETSDYLFTMSELVGVILPAVREYVPHRTLQHWASRGKLQARDYTAQGEPKYLLADVRKLRDEKPQKATTGAAAHKKRAS